MNNFGVVVAGSLEHVHTRHLYLSTCALHVDLDNSRPRAETGTAASKGRLSLNFQVYVFTNPN